MEDKQITQPEPSQSNTDLPQSSSQQYSPDSKFLADLIRHRAWLLWLGVGTFLFTIIYISLVSITQVGFVKQSPESTSSLSENPEANQSDSIPLWLLGMGIVAGAAGAVAISKMPSFQLQLLKRFQATSLAFSRRRQRKELLLPAKQQLSLPASESVAHTLPTVSVPLSENQPLSPEPFEGEEILIVLDESLYLDADEPVLADEELLLWERSHDLVQSDKNQPTASTQSLVEMLDIRQKLPLSTILGESFHAQKN